VVRRRKNPRFVYGRRSRGPLPPPSKTRNEKSNKAILNVLSGMKK